MATIRTAEFKCLAYRSQGKYSLWDQQHCIDWEYCFLMKLGIENCRKPSLPPLLVYCWLLMWNTMMPWKNVDLFFGFWIENATSHVHSIPIPMQSLSRRLETAWLLRRLKSLIILRWREFLNWMGNMVWACERQGNCGHVQNVFTAALVVISNSAIRGLKGHNWNVTSSHSSSQMLLTGNSARQKVTSRTLWCKNLSCFWPILNQVARGQLSSRCHDRKLHHLKAKKQMPRHVNDRCLRGYGWIW